MKNLTNVLLLLLFCLTTLKAQNFTATALNPQFNTDRSCDSSISIGISPLVASASQSELPFLLAGTGNLSTSDSITVTVDWGDSTITQHKGLPLVSGQDIVFYPALEKTYNIHYTSPLFNSLDIQIDVTVPGSPGISHTINNFKINRISAQFPMTVEVDTNGDSNGDIILTDGVPVNCYVLYGYTIPNTTLTNGVLNFPDYISNYDYLVTPDPVWLFQNNYIQVLSSQSAILSANCSTQYQNDSVITINNYPMYNMQISGKLYCDENGNGSYDNTEQVYTAVPVIIQVGNQVYNAISNNAGNYSKVIQLYSGNNVSVKIDSTYLSNTGIIVNVNPVYFISSSLTQQQNIDFKFDCSAIPQECYTGIVFCDLNSNGTREPGEFSVTSAQIHFPPLLGAPAAMLQTNGSGYFQYCPGNTIAADRNVLVKQSVNSQDVFSYSLPRDSSTHLIPITCNLNYLFSDLSVYTLPLSTPLNYFQNTAVTLKFIHGYSGLNAPGAYKLIISYPQGVVPDPNSYQLWNFTDSSNNLVKTVYALNNPDYAINTIVFNIPGGLNNGILHQYKAKVIPLLDVTDVMPFNNISQIMFIVGNSYDPNDKNCSLPELISSDIQDSLNYTVRFQNTGTAPAQDIYILDTLSECLDINTFQITSYSHSMNVEFLENRAVRFNFPNIWLPDSSTNLLLSNGHVSYSIKETPQCSLGDTILNTAYIYFDWNPAIITNTTRNINIKNLGFEVDNKELIRVYPNPTYYEINIETANDGMCYLYDMTGRIVLSKFINKKANIPIQHLPSGVYLLRLGSNTFKVLISN
jgi:uncharacterized repeat protein (TIGR01451 family)